MKVNENLIIILGAGDIRKTGEDFTKRLMKS